MSNSKSLNKQQLQIVNHNQGSLLVVAGAGTGKTTAIIEKIKNLVIKDKINPNQIFTATFTQKSADEMLERLDKIMPLGYEEPWIGTFHALCDKILRLEGFHIGIDPNFNVITNTKQWLLIKENIFNLGLDHYRPLGNPSTFISDLIKFFSRLQDEDISPKEFLSYSKQNLKSASSSEEKESATHLLELATAFKKYHQIKIKNSVYDFGDLITQTLHLFRSNKSILEKYQQNFKHILIDEFQDTNYAQYQLIKLLAPPNKNPNLIVVGDDDQSIYKFRGAAISNILGFKKEYPDSKEIVLTKNYRSTQSILDHSYHLIQHNNPDRLEAKLGIDKKLESQIETKKLEQHIIKTNTHQNEVDLIVEKIIQLVSTNEYTYKDFAILSRSNSQLDEFVQSFKSQRIPYQRIGNRGLFDQQEIKSLLDFLHVLNNPEDSTALFHFMHSQQFDISPSQIINLLNQSKTKNLPLFNIIKEEFTQNDNLNAIIDTVEFYQDFASKNPTSKVLHEYIIQSGYIKNLTNIDSVENSLKIQNINLFFDHIKQFEKDEVNTHLTHFIDILNQWIEAGENPAQATIEDIDTVNLLTIHAAKGLEFPVVFIPSMISGRFPSINRKDRIQFPTDLIKESLPEGNYHVEEERRLLYVAMTRAKHFLYLTYAEDYGGVRKRKPSGFLTETELQIIKDTPKNIIDYTQSNNSPATYLDEYKNIEIKSLSYTQIDTFKGCPLKYKYRYVLKVPTLPYQSLTFGRSIHQTLHDFHLLTQQGKDPSQKELLKLYKQSFDETGYDSEEHKTERYEQGKLNLITYYKKYKNIFGNPIHLERSFKLKIDDVIIRGVIDRIDNYEDGSFEVIDYKTGKPKDQKAADKNDQLSLYALAAKEVFDITPDKLSLYYVESAQKVETKRTDEQIQKTKNQLNKDIAKIKSSDFKATPNPIRCKFCEYNRICPFAIK